MSASSAPLIEEPKFTGGAFPEVTENEGEIIGKPVVEAKGQTSKGWYILAILVGSVVFVGVGGFGAVGLLKSYGIITLNNSFEWLSTAIGFIGNTPHFLSLWAIAAGGVVVGGGLIALGSYKIHTAEAKTDEPAAEGVPEKSPLSSFSAENLVPNHVRAKNFERFSSNTFSIEERTIEDKDKVVRDPSKERFFIVLRNPQGELLSSATTDLESSFALGRSLCQSGYQPANASTAISLFFRPNRPELELSPENITAYSKKLQKSEYLTETIEYAEENKNDGYFYVLKTPKGDLLFSTILNEKQAINMKAPLQTDFKFS